MQTLDDLLMNRLSGQRHMTTFASPACSSAPVLIIAPLQLFMLIEQVNVHFLEKVARRLPFTTRSLKWTSENVQAQHIRAAPTTDHYFSFSLIASRVIPEKLEALDWSRPTLIAIRTR